MRYRLEPDKEMYDVQSTGVGDNVARGLIPWLGVKPMWQSWIYGDAGEIALGTAILAGKCASSEQSMHRVFLTALRSCLAWIRLAVSLPERMSSEPHPFREAVVGRGG